MTLRPTIAILLVCSASLTAQGPGRVIDEGTFTIARAGEPTETENFRITQVDNGQIQATGQLSGGAHRATSKLVTDSLGTPVDFQVAIFDGTSRAPATTVRAGMRSGRLSALTHDRRGNEAMHEYAVSVGRCLVLDDELMHLTYFVGLGKRSGNVEVINPRGAHGGTFTLTARGLEPVVIGGKTVTGTHYSLSNGSTGRDYWIDAGGRLLRVEIAAAKLTATREELPR